MSALDELLKQTPDDYDEVDVANHLLHYRQAAAEELAKLRADNKKLREILDEIQWHGGGRYEHRCYFCWKLRKEGHTDDCELKQALT